MRGSKWPHPLIFQGPPPDLNAVNIARSQSTVVIHAARERFVKKGLLAVCLFALALGAAQAQKLTGAGATFPYPIYSKWFTEYSAAHPGVEINYQSIGSGGGITQVTKGTVDFGASDMPMKDEQLAASPIKLVHIPTVLGAVVPIGRVRRRQLDCSSFSVLSTAVGTASPIGNLI